MEKTYMKIKIILVLNIFELLEKVLRQILAQTHIMLIPSFRWESMYDAENNLDNFVFPK